MADQSLSLTQQQRQIQILAPQLRQSLELLQVPMLELRTLIQNELQQNPTLEEKPVDTPPVEVEPAGVVDDTKELNFKEEFAILSRLDEEWCRYFMQGQEYEPYDINADKRRRFFLDSQVQNESLQHHLSRQLALADVSEQDQHIGSLIIGSINDDGYLMQDIEELATSAGCDPAHMKDILALIQDCDPVGVGTRNLQECLLLQLERLGHGDSLAAAIVRDHLELLGNKHIKEIAHALKVPIEDIHQAAKLIATLEPKPGRAFSPESPRYILPDVLVEKVDGQYRVILNDDEIPDLRISRHYRELMNTASTPNDVKTYIQDRIRSGLFLIKSVAQRQHTMYRVAMAIVTAQLEFLDRGIAHLKPLTMAEVARTVGLHETTICRCIANKHMQTPRGLFEMKYFFTPGLKTTDGKTVSNKTVQDMITALIADEDHDHPFSDQDILEKLQAKGIHIARRTIAKYRIALKILPSHLRKPS
ncbi:MAG: RNA polymerase factor sigma-54 [Verrucomicrobia bacterium]|nr:RNA polymerase factor sigma-54 [Verrucomicrobiota bacterium]MBU4290898.1 RNA polymerase factor sigma-54 [Verrucomicrobiota bacterium]MBU4497983.1 RNA polymerase factor sigma-54 [Verrucomicrobiota bacterium]